MYYVMSDIHGRYDRYLKMLSLLNLTDNDKVYVLGDVIDKHEGGIDILLDIMGRSNVELILGNHEHMMINCLRLEGDEIVEDDKYFDLWASLCNGGSVTYGEFKKRTPEEQRRILKYLNSLYVQRVVRTGSGVFTLAHASCATVCKNLKLSDLTESEVKDLVWRRYFSEGLNAVINAPHGVTHVVFGHTPVLTVNNTSKVFRNISCNGVQYMDIDCNCRLPKDMDSALGCVCLDTLKEYYVTE